MNSDAQWLSFRDARFPIRFRYPHTTPDGHPIEMREYLRGRTVRLHLTSRGSNELYFEVARFARMSVNEVYEKLKADVEGRLGAAVGTLQTITFAGLPAYEMRFQWSAAERFVIFIPQGDILYRILYDPTSGLNLQIRSTVAFM